MIMTILIDERGRAVLHELPYSSQSLFPEPLVRLVLGSVPKWRYHPAMKFGQARRTWANIQLDLTP
jgi:hypothetical protein